MTKKKLGKILLMVGIPLVVLGILMLIFVHAALAGWILICSILANAAGLFLLIFSKK